MKRCPTCNKTYPDDSMSFCLDDGGPLLSVAEPPPPQSFDPSATIPFHPPRDTTPQGDPYRSGGTPPSGQFQPPGSGQYPPPGGSGQYPPPGGSGQYSQPGSGQFPPPPSGQQQYSPSPSWSPTPGAQPARKGSALPWIIGGVVLLVVLGIGAVAIIAVIASMSDNSNNRNNGKSISTDSNSKNSNNSNSNTNDNSNTTTTTSSTPTLRDDFSTAKWWTGTVASGSIWYQSGEYHMRGTTGNFISIYAPNSQEYYTKDTTVRATARSVSGQSPSYGYGLVVHGEMKNNFYEDYGFLIYTGDSPQYSVVVHKGGKETPMVKWTKSSLIRTGSSPNQLEVRIKGNQLTFYINGQYATSIIDTANFATGRVGFYSSDTNEIAFDDLELYK
jgi:hypothetical protein